MSGSIKTLEGFDKMLQISESLYVKVFVDAEGYTTPGTDSTIPYPYWEEVAANFQTTCQQAIKAIYKATGVLPTAGQRIANGKDPCLIKFVDYHVFGEDVLAWFECEQMPHRS